MSEQKHTPGPWFEATDSRNNIWIESEAEGYQNYVLAYVHGPEWEANANLIAAAPKMLSALFSAEECLTTWVALHGDTEIGEILKEVRAAIAKAKGQEET